MSRLLFDENLSPRLVARLIASFPDSRHVRDLGLVGMSDTVLWDRAGRDGLTIVTKDDDFCQMSYLRGAPPKVIWLVVGNAGTDAIAALLERQREVISRFEHDTVEAVLVLRLLLR